MSWLLLHYIITRDIIWSLYHFSNISRFVELLLFFSTLFHTEAAQFLRKCIPPLQSSPRWPSLLCAPLNVELSGICKEKWQKAWWKIIQGIWLPHLHQSQYIANNFIINRSCKTFQTFRVIYLSSRLELFSKRERKRNHHINLFLPLSKYFLERVCSRFVCV